MRIQVFLIGAALWVVAGVAAYMVFSRGPVPVPQGANDTAKVVNPSGKQPIKIVVAEPEVEKVVPADWQPPIVDGWALTNHLGEEVTPETLRGMPYVATFIFTRCATHCPDLVRRVYDLEQRLQDVDVRFVTVTVDPDHDTVEHLGKYAEIFTEDANRWMFLTGSKEQILNLARFGSRQMRSEPLDAETFIGPQAAHSLRLMHVGPDGRLIGSYHFQREEDMLALRRVLEGKSETRDEHKPLPATEEMTPIAYWEDGSDAALNDQFDQLQDGVDGDALAGLPDWAQRLPAVNAAMNGLAGLFLVVGFVAIKQKKARVHRNFMVLALLASAVFLGCYAVYHVALGQYTDSHGKPFEGEGIARTIYFAILIPHVILAAAVPVLAGIAVYRAWKKRWEAHRRIAKIAYPVWMFVSVTGVVIYFMLYHWPSAAA